MDLTRLIYERLPLSTVDVKCPVMRPECQNGFDRVVDIAAAFEFYRIPYAVWGTMLHFIYGIPVGIPVSSRRFFSRIPSPSDVRFLGNFPRRRGRPL